LRRLDGVTPEARSDFGLLRFLKEHHDDVSSAAQAFRIAAEWRVEHKVAYWREVLILKQKLESASFGQIVAHYTDMSRLPHWDRIGRIYPERLFNGHDNHSNPILFTNQEMIENIFPLMTVVSKEEFDEYRVARTVNLELYLDALSQKLNRMVQTVYIWNLAGMTRSVWRNFESKSVKSFLGDYDHGLSKVFPEQSFRIIGVNIPTWLMLVWNVVKRILPTGVLKKAFIIGQSGVKDTLLRSCEIPITALPASLGGAYESRPGPPKLDYKSFSIEVPASASRSLDVEIGQFGCVYWSIHVHAGKEIWLAVDQFADGKKVHSMPLVRLEGFHRAAWSVLSAHYTLKFRFENRSPLFFSRSVDLLVVPQILPCLPHDGNSVLARE
jgi:hypothetical protein